MLDLMYLAQKIEDTQTHRTMQLEPDTSVSKPMLIKWNKGSLYSLFSLFFKVAHTLQVSVNLRGCQRQVLLYLHSWHIYKHCQSFLLGATSSLTNLRNTGHFGPVQHFTTLVRQLIPLDSYVRCLNRNHVSSNPMGELVASPIHHVI